MVYDEALAERWRRTLDGIEGVSEKRMMGGVCFFLHGAMLGGAHRERDGAGRFMFRVGKEREAQALAYEGAEPVSFTGRRMGGMVFVDESGCDAAALRALAVLALDFVSEPPAKPKGK